MTDSNNRIRISIIIPVYNVEKHIDNCLKSLIDNSLDSYEIILVDDGSTDNCPSICDDYARKYDYVNVVHKKNGSAASARNAGLEIARGDYITFLDSDDYVDDEYIGYLYRELKNNSDIFVLPFYIDYLDVDNNSSTSNESNELINVSAEDAVRFLEEKSIFNMVWNKVYSKALLEREPETVFALNSEPGEDLIFNCRCFSKAGTVTVLNRPFYHWVRRGEDTLANRFREDLYERNKVFINYRNKLYKSLGIAKTDFSALAKGNLDYIFACIPNMYRVGKKFDRKKRLEFYKDIISSEMIEEWVKSVQPKEKLLKQFVYLYKKQSPFLMDTIYSIEMGLRNSLNGIWVRMRKQVKN